MDSINLPNFSSLSLQSHDSAKIVSVATGAIPTDSQILDMYANKYEDECGYINIKTGRGLEHLYVLSTRSDNQDSRGEEFWIFRRMNGSYPVPGDPDYHKFKDMKSLFEDTEMFEEAIKKLDNFEYIEFRNAYGQMTFRVLKFSDGTNPDPHDPDDAAFLTEYGFGTLKEARKAVNERSSNTPSGAGSSGAGSSSPDVEETGCFDRSEWHKRKELTDQAIDLCSSEDDDVVPGGKRPQRDCDDLDKMSHEELLEEAKRMRQELKRLKGSSSRVDKEKDPILTRSRLREEQTQKS
jgi:hypothetical protein